jgi:PAS domain S-box-containing protein
VLGGKKPGLSAPVSGFLFCEINVKKKETVKCWEAFECNELECPVFQSKELMCWLVSGTHCRNEIQGKFLEKMEMCFDCRPFKENVSRDSMEATLKVVSEQFIQFRQLVDDRDRELESISMEMAVGLSEVFDALKKISSGNPLVRISDTSELELISKLKHMVNVTSTNLAEIVDLSHEFAIGLAEHFDVLHRVSRGDLTARVHGSSQLELLELLKDITNQTIKNVSQEIAYRQRADVALRKSMSKLQRSYEQSIIYARELRKEVSERRQAEIALRESREQHRRVLEASPDPVVVYDMEGNGTYISSAFTEVFGWTPEEVLGRRIDYVPEKNQPETKMIIRKLLAGESFSGVESRRYTKDGRILDVSISAAIYENREGVPVGSVHILRDITDHKRAVEALREARSELERRVDERTAELTKAN